jgi:hypothetical protein
MGKKKIYIFSSITVILLNLSVYVDGNALTVSSLQAKKRQVNVRSNAVIFT